MEHEGDWNILKQINLDSLALILQSNEKHQSNFTPTIVRGLNCAFSLKAHSPETKRT